MPWFKLVGNALALAFVLLLVGVLFYAVKQYPLIPDDGWRTYRGGSDVGAFSAPFTVHNLNRGVNCFVRLEGRDDNFSAEIYVATGKSGRMMVPLLNYSISFSCGQLSTSVVPIFSGWADAGSISFQDADGRPAERVIKLMDMKSSL
ncbi:MAG: hypothetical protein H5U32_03055 [Pseudomonas balearica]|uniref:hypothetical protein n=1 Tax=Stutzerimonas balearica TaxID=74829 RepID=UPI0019C94C12|nr:hypothetical protein [Stutzerimonas balearica]MBC7198207.1 hypothetical protein [Stutzerimonas balearica]